MLQALTSIPDPASSGASSTQAPVRNLKPAYYQERPTWPPKPCWGSPYDIRLDGGCGFSWGPSYIPLPSLCPMWVSAPYNLDPHLLCLGRSSAKKWHLEASLKSQHRRWALRGDRAAKSAQLARSPVSISWDWGPRL